MPVALIIWLAALLFLGSVASTRSGRALIASAVTDAVAWAMQALFAVAPAIAVTFAQGLATAFETNREKWAPVVAVFVRELTGSDIDQQALVAQIRGGGLAAAAPVLAAPLIDAVRSAIAPEGELTPEAGQRNLNTLLGLNTLFALQGWWVEAVGSLVSLNKFGAALTLHDLFQSSLGLGRLSRLAWRVPVQKAIADPLTRHYNRAYRFTNYSLGEATSAHHRGLLTDDQFLDLAADLGYSYEKATVLLALAQKTMPEADVEILWRKGLITEEDALRLVEEQGYGHDRAAAIWEARRGVRGQTLLDELAKTARDLFRQGDLTEDEYRAYLAEAHYHDEEIGLALQADQLALRREKPLSDGQLFQAIQHAALTQEQVRAELRKRHYTDDTIDVLFAIQVRQLTSGQVVDLFVRGAIVRAEAITRLERLGYTADDAQSLLDLRTRVLSEGQVLDALTQALISVQTAREDLQKLGFPDETIDVLLAFQRKSLSPADVQAAITHGLVSPEEGLGRLLAAGYSAVDARTIVDLRLRLLSVGQILDAYGDDLIARADAVRDLEVRGLSASDAALVVGVFDAKQAQAAARKAAAPRRPTPPPPPAPPP